jgi:RNA polymerase sigma-70 factor, ECF subfamily
VEAALTKTHSQVLRESGVADEVTARLEVLYRRHRDDVYRLALRYGDRGWAEDVTQDVFVTLCRTIDRLDEDDDLQGWFYRVTHNRCLSRLRRRAVRDNPAVRWLLGHRSPPPEDPEHLAAQQQGVRRVLAVLDTLPVRQRLAFCMYHLDGREQSEIGAILGFSKSYICKLIKRAERSVLARGEEIVDG